MKSWHAFSLTLIGEGLSQIFAYLLGIGIASGIATRPSWSAADEISPGAVMVAAFDTLGRFGKFCGVVVALGVIANNVPGTYSASLGFQCLGSWPLKVPRFFWNTVGVIIYTICGAVGRNHLYSIFEDLLPLMGYWVTIWFTISLEEQFIFRRHIGYDWSAWNDKSKLPHGFAALTAFLVGWAGSIISMDQVWYAGPVAKLVGADGSDVCPANIRPSRTFANCFIAGDLSGRWLRVYLVSPTAVPREEDRGPLKQAKESVLYRMLIYSYELRFFISTWTVNSALCTKVKGIIIL
jgi:purine-cytosine permease-like protein